MSTTSPTPAQEEFASFLARNDRASRPEHNRHPEDQKDHGEHDDSDGLFDSDLDEEDRFRSAQIEAAMRMPTLDHAAHSEPQLPPATFDSGHATGVKGVIADARNYELAKKSKWRSRARAVRNSVFGLDSAAPSGARSRSASASPENSDGDEALGDEENFLKEWRESRRRELERDNRPALRQRRTSPSVRVYGRLDEVDALGYLDAIEKVGRETVVIVFVYDHECLVSSVVESAMRPLVSANPNVHFVKVHYEDIEFDNAGVPAILAYRNQGDLFANLTGLIEMMPDNEDFDSDSLKTILQKHHVL